MTAFSMPIEKGKSHRVIPAFWLGLRMRWENISMQATVLDCNGNTMEKTFENNERQCKKQACECTHTVGESLKSLLGIFSCLGFQMDNTSDHSSPWTSSDTLRFSSFRKDPLSNKGPVTTLLFRNSEKTFQ